MFVPSASFITLLLVWLSMNGTGAASIGTAALDVSYTDRKGDAAAALDITTVRLSSDGSSLSMKVTLVGKTLNSNQAIGATLDTDVNTSTGNQQGFEYYWEVRGGGPGAIVFYTWSGSGWTRVYFASYAGSQVDFGVTVSFSLSEVRNPSRFRFYAYTKEGSQAADTTPFWSFDVPSSGGGSSGGGSGGGGSGSGTLAYVAKSPTLYPNPPQAGVDVGLFARFVFRGSGKLVKSGRLTCAGTIGSHRVSGDPARFKENDACFFELARSSGGKLFSGKMTLALSGRSVSVLRRARISSPSALTLTGPRTIPSAPVTGRQFSAAVKVELVRPGSSRKPIRRGEVECRATVAGKRLPVDYSGFVRGIATCAWPIPSSARGSTLRGTITVRSDGITATKTFTRRVR